MSIDINYYSFSPSRADKGWPHFIEDLLVLRKKYSTWEDHQKDRQDLYKKQDEIEKDFESRIAKERKKIFDFFDKKGYIIPWIEWGAEVGKNTFGHEIRLSNEDKMDYLLYSGCVYPKGANSTSMDVPYLMLKLDAPDLKESYEQIIDERDNAIKELSKKTQITPNVDENVVLNKRQEELYNGSDLSYLVFDYKYSKKDLFGDLKSLDIYYGSVTNDFFENPKLEYAYLESIVSFFKLKTEDDIPTRNEWIRLFRSMNNESIQELSKSIAKDFDWSIEDAEWGIKDYLKSVRPVVKDLQETPDAIFISEFGGELDVNPKSSEIMLKDRIIKHANTYSEQLLPVL